MTVWPFAPDEDDEEEPGSDAPAWTDIQVEVSDPEVAGELLGPDGAPLATVYARPVVPFGFRR